MDIGGEAVLPLDDGQNVEPLNISDVFEAITLADPSFGAMEPYVQIIEQPASKALRFRYECEGRSAGSIPGVNNTSENRTYPTIKIFNYVGQVVIVVSCVTKDKPYRPHPHNLVGRERCEKGVCTVTYRVTEESNEYQFKNLGIQCVKKRDIAEALHVRQTLRVDPFRTGFSHSEQSQSLDLNAVRLCFQVFVPDAMGRLRRPLAPVVSDIIYDKKAMSDLLIVRASHCSGTARGGTQVILLCEKITKEDVVVLFYLEENNTVVWQEAANTFLVHKQVAIGFETPAFRDPRITDHVTVRFEIKRLSDNARSNSLPFEYTPDLPDIQYKRKKVSSLLQTYDNDRMLYQPDQKIKSEPRDKTPPYLPQYGEQWLAENIQGGLQIPGPSNNPFGQEMWGAPSYVQHPSTSPNLQPLSPSMQMGQNLQVLSSVPAISPNLQQMSPHGQVMSPHSQVMSPHAQVLSPHRQVMSPHAQVMSPHGQIMSPHGQVMSPHGQLMSPHGQVMSPHGQAMSPHGQAMSPHGQAMSPHGQVMSPHGQTMQNLQVMSPQHGQSNLGHISPNLVQQVQDVQAAQINPGAMDTDTNSTPSLSNLLLDRDALNMNYSYSGELSALLGD